MTGLVIKTTGADYLIRNEQGDFSCKIKGNFRIKGIKATNPITVGDRVEFDPESGYITDLHDRRNYIVRKPTNLSKQLHVIAANLDQCVLVVTISNPTTATTFIDRFLATSEAYNIPTTIVFNKIDLLDADELEYLKAIDYLYRSIGYNTLQISATQGVGIDQLNQLLKGKITLLSGNSPYLKRLSLWQLLPHPRTRLRSSRRPRPTPHRPKPLPKLPLNPRRHHRRQVPINTHSHCVLTPKNLEI